MNYHPYYEKVVAIKEKSAGNEEIGDKWFETKTFERSTPISKIIEWASDCSGRLIITIDESTVDEKYEF